jgi:hypothetical protein
LGKYKNQIQKKSTTNKRNTEMVKKNTKLGLIALLVVIILGIALTVYFSTKKSDDVETSKISNKPQLVIDGASKKLNPRPDDGDNDDATVDISEGYKIEYATGDAQGNESIDLKITWTTGMGYENVEQLIFRREIGGNKVQEDIVYNSGPGIENESNGEITFKGTDLTNSENDIVGVNKVSVWWNSVSGDTFLTDTGDQIEIKQSDIDTTLDLSEVKEVDIPITIAPDSFKFEILNKETLYLIEEFNQCFKMKNLDGGKVQFTNLKTGNADKLWDNTDTYRLKKYKDGYMLGHPTENNEVLVRKVLTKENINWDDKSIDHKPTFKKLDEMKKADYARALFHLEPVRTAIRSDQNEGKMELGKNYKSPSGTYGFKQHTNRTSLNLNDFWASAFPPDFNKPCDTARIQSDGNFLMKVTGSQDDWGYRSETHEWGTGNGPYRVVVGDNATVAILKKDGQVIHYIFRAKPISIAVQTGYDPKRYSWTTGPRNRFKHGSLAVIHDRWLSTNNPIILEGNINARKEAFKWVAFTLVDEDAGYHYELFGRHSTYGRGYVYLPDGACDIQSNSKNTPGGSVIVGQKSDSTFSSLYKGPEHTKLVGYDTWKIYFIPSLPMEGYIHKTEHHDIIQSDEDQIKEEHFGDLQCRTRSKEFDGANAYVYRHWRSDTDGWTNTCGIVKLKNINNLEGKLNYETDPSQHNIGCNDPLKSARKACTGPLDVPEGKEGAPVRK